MNTDTPSSYYMTRNVRYVKWL